MTKTTSKKLSTHPAAKRDPGVSRVYMLRTTLVMFLIAVTFAIIGGLLHLRASTVPKTYRSDFMKVGFTYTAKYSLEGKLSDLALVDSNTKSKIQISKYGTNFSSTADHVDNSIRRKIEKPILNFSMGGDYDGIVVEYARNRERRRIWYFVKDYAVYQFETNDPALFADLDSISKSFRILQ